MNVPFDPAYDLDDAAEACAHCKGAGFITDRDAPSGGSPCGCREPRTPYPEFCSRPECLGAARCPRDPVCND